jgi:hypothetical protein
MAAEDEQTNYVDIGPVNKVLNMLCAWHGAGGDVSAAVFRKVRKTRQVGLEVGPTSAFYRCIPTGMHGPTCIFWANLTPFSLKHLLRVPDYLWVVEDGTLKSF